MVPPLICFFDFSQLLPIFSVLSPQETSLNIWGCFSLHLLSACNPALSSAWHQMGSRLPAFPLSLGSGLPWRCKQEAFLPRPPMESFLTNLLCLNCLKVVCWDQFTNSDHVRASCPKACGHVDTYKLTCGDTHVRAHAPSHTHTHTGIFMHTLPWVQLPGTATWDSPTIKGA